MKYAILSGSPKPSNSCSEMLAKHLFTDMEHITVFHCMDIHKIPDIFHQLQSFDTIVLSFPLYFDAQPSHLLSFLLQWEKERKRAAVKVNLYVIVNCGFFEGKQNRYALQVVENWCTKSGMCFMGGIGIGAGPMLNEIQAMAWEHGPKAPVDKALRRMREAIITDTAFENSYVQPAFPRSLYIKMAHHSWNKQLKKNGYDPKRVYPKR